MTLALVVGHPLTRYEQSFLDTLNTELLARPNLSDLEGRAVVRGALIQHLRTHRRVMPAWVFAETVNSVWQRMTEGQ